MPSCTYTETKKGIIVKCCGLEAQKDSAFCPRHTFLYNVEEKAKYDKDQDRIQTNLANLENKLRRTRLQHCAAGFVFIGSDTCACGKHIEFWRTPKLKTAPYDPMPEENSIAVSHFATCTRRSMFRKAS